MDCLELFPTQIFVTRYADYERQNAAMLPVVAEARFKSVGVVRSNVGDGSWHSDDLFVFEYAEPFTTLKFIQKLAHVAAKEWGYNVELKINNAWVVVSPKGSGNSKHNHPRSLVSAAYYIKAPLGSSPIVFHDPRAARIFSEPNGISRHSAGEVRFDVADGALFLFPSWLEHSVPLNASESERVVLSVNFGVM